MRTCHTESSESGGLGAENIKAQRFVIVTKLSGKVLLAELMYFQSKICEPF